MRKASPLDTLFPKTTQGVLAATLLDPQRRWYLSDLARHLRRTPSSLQGPLAALVDSGILRREKEGNRVYFEVDPQCPFLSELQGIVAKTVGLVDVLRDALRPFSERITAAFVYGSVARSQERSSSDIDLMVIGTVGLSDIAPLLRQAEERLNRPVNATVYTIGEFAKKLAAGHHFVRSVLDKEKLFVLGSDHDLGKAASRRPRRASSHKQAGA